ncbi:hypothetical protein HPSH112_05855 [Helicobacter pylori Shi112]|nr:hypothetical protein HPSH112_05855 [Helicobacter pylori Shi112]
MAKVLYLEISFLGFNHCFLKIFSFRDFLETPPFFKKRVFNRQTRN